MGKREHIKPDYELLFHPEGTVELFDRDENSIWQSDADDDFADQFEGDFFDGEDADEILDYLNEIGKVDLDEDEIDIIENDLNDEAADTNVIDADFTEVRKSRKPQ